MRACRKPVEELAFSTEDHVSPLVLRRADSLISNDEIESGYNVIFQLLHGSMVKMVLFAASEYENIPYVGMVC